MSNWVTFQLSERGETTLDDEPKIITEVIKKFIKSEFFLPVYYNKSKSYENKIFLIKGYIFVKYDPNEAQGYVILSKTQYFVGPLLSGKKLHMTPDTEIQSLKNRLLKMTQPNIKKGDTVKVIDGKYKNLTAIVTDCYPKRKEVDLSVKLKCMNILVPGVPVVCLKNINEKKEKITLHAKILEILKTHTHGLTRKQILSKIELTENEKKRVSTSLSRAVKKGQITCFKNENKRSVFVF